MGLLWSPRLNHGFPKIIPSDFPRTDRSAFNFGGCGSWRNTTLTEIIVLCEHFDIKLIEIGNSHE